MWIKWGPGKCVPHSKDFEEAVDTTGEEEPEESSGKKTPEWVKNCLSADDKHSCNKVFALNPTLNCGHETGLESATLRLVSARSHLCVSCCQGERCQWIEWGPGVCVPGPKPKETEEVSSSVSRLSQCSLVKPAQT